MFFMSNVQNTIKMGIKTKESNINNTVFKILYILGLNRYYHNMCDIMCETHVFLLLPYHLQPQHQKFLLHFHYLH